MPRIPAFRQTSELKKSTKGWVSSGIAMVWPPVICAFHGFAAKSEEDSPTEARSASVMSSMMSPSLSGLARVRWDTATSGGLLPTVARVTFV